MTIRQLNLVNGGLILLSALCAVRFPLETFLGAYAFLGPLHYLTEISWLEQRKYFLPNDRRVWVLVGLCALIFPFTWMVQSAYWIIAPALFVAFFGSVLLLRQTRTWIDGLFLVGIGLVPACALFLPGVSLSLRIFAVLLPTIVHVYMFTGLFMLNGVLRNKKDWSGWMSFVLFVLCGIGLAYSGSFFSEWTISPLLHPLSQSFSEMQAWLVRGLGAFELGVMRCVGFAYLYHYLNWFSKTSIIQWHAISKRRAVIIVAIWLLSVGLYLVDYRTGLFALLFLSLLHVFLEFPLNWKTLQQIVTGRTKKRAE
jgi:hypothetical protein